jgi:hypothetical protein
VQLYINQFRQKEYAFKFNSHKLQPSLDAYIIDNYLRKETAIDLNTGVILPFKISDDSASFSPNRFMLIFKTQQTLPVIISAIKAYQKETKILVEWSTDTEVGVDKYEIEKRSSSTNQFIKRATANAKGNSNIRQQYEWTDHDVVAGNNYYRIKCIQKNGGIIYSNEVNVTVAGKQGSISIFPNPITSRVVNLRLRNLNKNTYTITILNNSGQRIYTSSIKYDGTQENFKLTPFGLIRKGIYRLQISDNNEVTVRNLFFK